MSATVQYKLLQHQEQPPEEAWAAIVQRLQEEYNPADIYLSQRITDAGIVPPAAAWEAIASDLTLPDASDITIRGKEKKQPGRIVPLIYKRISVAAITLFIAGLAAMYLFNNTSQKDGASQQSIVSAQTPDSNKPIQPAPPQTIAPEDPTLPSADQALASADPQARTTPSAARRTTNRMLNSTAMKYADPPIVQTVQALHPVSVDAPPLRDEQGNIIMDLDLISSPGSQHIIVTSPNGTQTKISSKFLHCLSYLNGNMSSADNNDMIGLAWKTRFQEWRNQFLQEAAFIPSANNFFDILELKEMIRER